MDIDNERTFCESIKSSQMDLIIVKNIEQLLSLCDVLEGRLLSTEERGRLVAVMSMVGG